MTIDDLRKYLPEDTTEIVSNAANGVDADAREYALSHNIKLTEFLLDYKQYGRRATQLKRNIQIIEYSDIVLVFWDGTSKGTKYVIDNCRKMGVEVNIYTIEKNN